MRTPSETEDAVNSIVNQLVDVGTRIEKLMHQKKMLREELHGIVFGYDTPTTVKVRKMFHQGE